MELYLDAMKREMNSYYCKLMGVMVKVNGFCIQFFVLHFYFRKSEKSISIACRNIVIKGTGRIIHNISLLVVSFFNILYVMKIHRKRRLSKFISSFTMYDLKRNVLVNRIFDLFGIILLCRYIITGMKMVFNEEFRHLYCFVLLLSQFLEIRRFLFL